MMVCSRSSRFAVTLFLVLVSILLQLSSTRCEAETSEASNPLSKGFGDHIKWVSLLDSFKLAWDEKKPIFLLIHKSWCGACQSLKPQLKNSLKFQELSENFVMVNVEDDEEPQDDKYAPDGGYIPRVLFLDPKGEVHADVTNRNGNPKYKYFYMDDRQVLDSMRIMLEKMETLDFAEKKNVSVDYDQDL